MHTLTDIRRTADKGTLIVTGVDDDTPTGTFYAVAKMFGQVYTYLLTGQIDDPNAGIIGRVWLDDRNRLHAASADRLFGGQILSTTGMQGTREAIAAVVANAAREN